MLFYNNQLVIDYWKCTGGWASRTIFYRQAIRLGMEGANEGGSHSYAMHWHGADAGASPG
jgi:hypothetical protein